ncbi:hypothetical protein APICC_09278 [Apis cerana cerana]|uniref:Uncharacterized protein n=1 Tax=Apis cerana cerana TaxID=94128 RepID=A0A2A3ELS1_APICC|nr:hypothetical protein APICC_09278 [Apis cerana cerana]
MEVISTRRYEARPPPASHPPILIDPENSVALVKEEEWETRKKKEITTTRQIETRVKRQVVLEDGEVVVDSGPLVTTNTTEDVEQQEHTTQERRTTGDQPQEIEWATGGRSSVDGASIVQKELNETIVRSREEIEERLETEDRQQLGDISDEAYQKAVRSNHRGDLRAALAESCKQLQQSQTGPRVVQHTTKSNKVIDTEKTLERKEFKPDGLIVTERKRTVEHEEINDDEVPDEGGGASDGNGDVASERRKESSQRFSKQRDEDVVDYISGGERIAREMRYVAETTEGERIGDWTPPSPMAMRTTRFHKHSSFPGENFPARKDVLTRKPLDFEEEDEARKFETSKWLESHFGSESRSSHGSVNALDDSPVPTSANTSYINVTMKSCPSKERDYQNVPNSNSRTQRRSTTGRDSSSPSGYFHGISEWSERYQGKVEARREKRTLKRADTGPSLQPGPRCAENVGEPQSRCPDGRARESEEIGIEISVTFARVQVEFPQQQEVERDPHLDTCSSCKKKLVGKLRSASNERKSKRASSGSISQLTQTDDSGPTYMQYNVIDKNIPLVNEKSSDGNPPERPPRSPKNAATNSGSNKITRTVRGGDHHVAQEQRSESTPPLHRYYLGEDPFGGSIYGREKGYRDARRAGKPRGRTVAETVYSVASSSLGRFSKSTSRLANEHEREEHYRSTQTLPRSLHTGGQYVRSQPQSRRQPPVVSGASKLGTSHSSIPSSGNKSRQYGSMINICIKNTVTSPKVSISSNIHQPPVKPERTYKSLSRSKSFNVEADRNGTNTPSLRIPYTSNLHLNRLDETPPLKSPGILASINRGNKDLLKNVHVFSYNPRLHIIGRWERDSNSNLFLEICD